MTTDHDREAREAAERRVREKQALQRTSLIELQNKQRREDWRTQKQALDENARKHAALIEDHRLALERAERDWQQQRERLAHKPAAVLAFGLGPAAPRDLNRQYEEARKIHEGRLQALEERFGQDLTTVRRERAEQLDAFWKANQARERDFDEERTGLERKQAADFEILVHRQMHYGRAQEPRRSIGDEFARRSRGPGREL
jgi:hypothetical protein